MKALVSLLFAGLVFSFNALADLTIVQKIDGAGSVTQMTVKLKGDKARIEAVPQVTTIMDSKTGEILTLMNDQKKFMRISSEKAKAIAQMTGEFNNPSPSADDHPKIKATGKKETIDGFQTEEYLYETPAFKASYWIALSYPNGAAIVKQLQAMAPASWGNASKGMPDFRDFPGLPLRTRVTMGTGEFTTTIVSVKQDPLNDSEFAPPKDFEEMKMPNMQDLDKKSQPTKP